jgi:hypothetical protein
MIKMVGNGNFSNYVAKLGTMLKIFLVFPYVSQTNVDIGSVQYFSFQVCYSMKKSLIFYKIDNTYNLAVYIL